jgi:hypothetical protein
MTPSGTGKDSAEARTPNRYAIDSIAGDAPEYLSEGSLESINANPRAGEFNKGPAQARY